MKKWEEMVKPIPYNWLLEESNPSVRFFTLWQLQDQLLGISEVFQSGQRIMEVGPVPRILAKQHPEGYWGKPENYYVYAKYKGTAHTMLILAQLGVEEEDARIKRMCEFILRVAQDPFSGGFSCKSDPEGHGDHRSVEPCFAGNMIWALIQLGYLGDPRLEKALRWITTYMRFDDGETRPPRVWPYLRKDNCWGKHTCHAGVIRTLKAISAIPQQFRTSEMNKTATGGAEFILKHHIFRKSRDLSQIAMSDWLQFTFPVMVTTDLIEVLQILLDLGIKDKRMQESMYIVLSKQRDDGTWLLERSHIGRYQTHFEELDKPSKWITLRALKAVKDYYS